MSDIADFPRMAVTAIPADHSLALARLARRITRALTRFPYFVVLSGFDRRGDPAELKRLVKAIGVQSGAPDAARLSFTEVKIDPDAQSRIRGATAYSRTHLPLAPHTDSSYLPRPHQLVAFQCVVADNEGGTNTMVPVDAVLGKLSAEDRERLRRSAYPFSRGHFPVLSEDGTGTAVRYYRRQIDQAVADGAALAASDAACLDRLDKLLADPALAMTFKLAEGEAVLFNNNRVLHARDGFPENSNRTLFRIRYHVDMASPASLRPALKWLFGKTRAVQTSEPAVTEPRAPHAPTGLDHHSSRLVMANRLLAEGRFAEALPHVVAIASDDSADTATLKLLAGLHYQCGDWAAMEATMARMAAREPIALDGRQKPHLPHVMRARGMKGSKHRLVPKAGRYVSRFEGGHFAVKDLLDTTAVNQSVLQLYDCAPQLPADWPQPALLLNTIACADRMPQSLAALADFCRAYPHIPVINHPDRVLQTSREANAARLRQIDGVVFPITVRVCWDGTTLDSVTGKALGSGIDYPMIVRPAETHTGVGVCLVHDEGALRTYFNGATTGRDYYLIQYHDISGVDGLYRKCRTFCIDGHYYPVAALAHDSWNVHSGDRYSVMDKDEGLQRAEQNYLADFDGWLGADNVRRLEAVRDLVGLDFFGIDFTKLPDGRLMLFELNAAMRHNFDHAQAFPYTAPYLKAVTRAFQQMIESRTGAVRGNWLALSARASM